LDLSTKNQEQKNHGYFVSSPTSMVILNFDEKAGDDTIAAEDFFSNSMLQKGIVPSIGSSFFFTSCGKIYSNLWNFVVSSNFIMKLSTKDAYGGRLQFRMLAPSFNGVPRPRRGRISIHANNGKVISCSLGSFPLPNTKEWTYYSVILREDFGWIEEPTGTMVSSDLFQQVLSNAQTLWIRGDLWGYDTTGQGQEVVYLNDIILYGNYATPPPAAAAAAPAAAPAPAPVA
jgi:hypothetical protein